ncbi:MAG: hypothetical protein QNK36_10735 [Colwellia sp.]|nr:hypothetical protein [Colwellia sp.]
MIFMLLFAFFSSSHAVLMKYYLPTQASFDPKIPLAKEIQGGK